MRLPVLYRVVVIELVFTWGYSGWMKSEAALSACTELSPECLRHESVRWPTFPILYLTNLTNIYIYRV
jgi:hypothetical protein